jgi:hypothetical protein
MAIPLLRHGDPLFWATMKDGKPDYYHSDDNKKDYASHLTIGQGDPLFQEVQDQGHRSTKRSIHVEFLDDDGMEKWVRAEEALQQMIISDEIAVEPMQTGFYSHGDPLMPDVTEALAAGDVITPQDAFHQVRLHHHCVESDMHGDPLWDAIIEDLAWDKPAGAIPKEVSKEKAD